MAKLLYLGWPEPGRVTAVGADGTMHTFPAGSSPESLGGTCVGIFRLPNLTLEEQRRLGEILARCGGSVVSSALFRVVYGYVAVLSMLKRAERFVLNVVEDIDEGSKGNGVPSG